MVQVLEVAFERKNREIFEIKRIYFLSFLS